MTTILDGLDEPATRDRATEDTPDEIVNDTAAEAAQRLRTTAAAVRLSVSWLGVRKSLTPGQKAEAAESFGAEGQFLSASKKLLDTRHPAYRAVTAVQTDAVAHWRSMTLPYPEPGSRLIRQDSMGPFDRRMRDYCRQLEEAVIELDRHYAEMRAAAVGRLGRLFNAADYPASLEGRSRSPETTPASSRRTTCVGSSRTCTCGSASGCRRGLTRRSGWPSRRFSKSCTSSSPTSPSGSPVSRMAGRRCSATRPWRTWMRPSTASAG